MKLKIILQIFLLSTIVVILSIFYFTFFKNKNGPALNNLTDKPEINLDKNISNQLINIEYNSSDNEGNTFYINAKKATIDANDETKNIVKMENVYSIINLRNSGPIIIKCKNAVYNKSNHNTFFFNKISIEYLNNRINSENFDLIFTEKKSKIYNEVVFEGDKINLYTDNILIDMVTGDIKLDMNNKNKTVKLISNELIN